MPEPDGSLGRLMGTFLGRARILFIKFLFIFSQPRAVEEKKFNLRDINYTSINKKQNKFLLMFENDCYYLNKASLYIKYDYIYILKIQNHHRKIQLSRTPTFKSRTFLEIFNETAFKESIRLNVYLKTTRMLQNNAIL